MATYADLVKVPEHLVAEIVEGELYATHRPWVRDAYTLTTLISSLRWMDGAWAKSRGWHILLRPELHLRDHVLVPDIVGWRMERMPVLPNMVAVHIPPDWVCEVLSPSTAEVDRRKLPLYTALGIEHVWIVDRELQILQTRRAGRAVTSSGAEVIRAEPFAAIEIDLVTTWN